MARKKRILLVDDDHDVHELLTAALRRSDRELVSAFDGLEGLRRVQETTVDGAQPWDLVVTDVLMPGLDGLGLLEQIRRLAPETPVVVMTVASTAENIAAAIRDQAFAWLSKPFRIEAARDLVEDALAGNAAPDDIEVLSASPGWLGLRLRCKMETAARVLPFIREMEQGLPEGDREKVAAAFREILLNAIEHGGGNDPDKRVRITYIRTARALLYYVSDPGEGFSMKALRHAAVSNPTESPFEHTELRQRLGMRPGGFGILMTRALVDELIYNEKGNEVLLIKYLPASGEI